MVPINRYGWGALHPGRLNRRRHRDPAVRGPPAPTRLYVRMAVRSAGLSSAELAGAAYDESGPVGVDGPGPRLSSLDPALSLRSLGALFSLRNFLRSVRAPCTQSNSPAMDDRRCLRVAPRGLVLRRGFAVWEPAVSLGSVL